MSSMNEELPFLEKPYRRESRGIDTQILVPWVLVILLSAYIALTSDLSNLRRPSEQIWTASDFAPARAAIKPRDITFTSSLEFVDPKHIYRIFDPTEQTYVGNSSAEIDEAWDDLILPADIDITDEEATTLPVSALEGLYRTNGTGQYRVEIEVFHSLHCLNMIRKRVYGDAYPEMLTDNSRIHVDHCIDSLRELLMCSGDMTPIPIEWSEKGERVNPNYAQRHSCRDSEALKVWTQERVDHKM